jgi:hypothetical protein
VAPRPAPTVPTYVEPGRASQTTAAGPSVSERPERLIGAAFAGGFVLAKLLGRLAR